MSGKSVLRLVTILLVGGALCALVYFAPAFMTKESNPAASPELHAGGTSTADLIIENGWRSAYRIQKGVEVTYESTGSTKGVKEMIEGKYPIAFTHSPITEDQKKAAKAKEGELVQVPMALCAVVPIYNLKGMKKKPPIKFTGQVLADVYLGKIKRWNHMDLKTINQGVELPDTEITVVHRSDSSGTTFLFVDYLAGASSEWKEKVGEPKAKINWPAGVGKERTFGVVRHVKETEGAIGYADLVYGYFGNISYGSVQNKDKTAFLHAEPENMTAVAKERLSAVADDLSFDLTNKSGKDSYPITGAVWAVCYRKQPAATRDEVVKFLTWAAHDGQKLTSKVYARLPEELVKRVDEKLKTIQ